VPADVGRRYAREHLTDHGDLLANLIRWAAGESIPLAIEGPGFLDCHLYRQGTRLILHVVNLTSAATWRAPMDELIAVGPLKASLPGFRANKARTLVRAGAVALSQSGGGVTFTLASVLDHEMVVLEA
jgi:hypothetical protein